MSLLRPDPLAPGALVRAALACGLLFLLALVAAAVRLLPWALDPAIRWATLGPFARSLFAVAAEAAVLVGWPIGWSLAAAQSVERGEAGMLASLGERPLQTAMRLAPQGILFALVLGAASLVLGRDAAAPGRVVGALVADGGNACARPPDVLSTSPATHAVPFMAAAWLCAPSGPLLVGRSPLGGLVFTAKAARVSDDLRRFELDTASLALPLSGATLGDAANGGLTVRVHVGKLVLRGLAPFAQASSLPPFLRALVVTSSAFAAAIAVVWSRLVLRHRRFGTFAALASGAAGPVVALVALRGLELRIPESGPGAWLLWFALVPMMAAVAASVASGLGALLPGLRRADTP